MTSFTKQSRAKPAAQGSWSVPLRTLALFAVPFLMMPEIARAQQGAAPAAAPDAKAAGASKAAKPAAQAQPGDLGLKGRVDSLEEQLVDMQVLVGTLESLAKSGGASAGVARASGGGGSDDARVDALENQVRALSTQVQALSDQIRSMGGTPRRSEVAPQAAPATGQAAAPQFGSTTVAGDAIGGLIDGGGASGPPVVQADSAPAPTYAASGAGAAAPPPPVTTAALEPAGEIANPKQLYETAYGYLLQRDYGAAEAAFDDFLKKFPSDSLAGNAQYWLGESHFVRGQYKAAASAFLKGYQTYAANAKAPDSLLKLAMSLDRLGQKDEACSSYSELNSKFPNAPQNVKTRAQSERQRVGCP
jgi:tol-pal system protein YbgF